MKITQVRQYYQVSKTSFAKALLDGQSFTDEVMVGLYEPDGSTANEFAFRWVPLMEALTHIRLEAYGDAWKALYENFQDLLQAMSEFKNQHLSPEAFGELCESLGIQKRDC